MPRTAGKVGLSCSNLEMATRSSRSWSSKHGQNLFLGRAHPHCCVCVCVWRLDFAKKTGFENQPIFAETTEKVVPKWRGRNAVFAPKGPKQAILELAARWSRNIFHSTAPPFTVTFKKRRKIVSFFAVHFLTAGLLLSFYD